MFYAHCKLEEECLKKKSFAISLFLDVHQGNDFGRQYGQVNLGFQINPQQSIQT
jgi:hypothetical protein